MTQQHPQRNLINRFPPQTRNRIQYLSPRNLGQDNIYFSIQLDFALFDELHDCYSRNCLRYSSVRGDVEEGEGRTLVQDAIQTTVSSSIFTLPPKLLTPDAPENKTFSLSATRGANHRVSTGHKGGQESGGRSCGGGVVISSLLALLLFPPTREVWKKCKIIRYEWQSVRVNVPAAKTTPGTPSLTLVALSNAA